MTVARHFSARTLGLEAQCTGYGFGPHLASAWMQRGGGLRVSSACIEVLAQVFSRIRQRAGLAWTHTHGCGLEIGTHPGLQGTAGDSMQAKAHLLPSSPGSGAAFFAS